MSQSNKRKKHSGLLIIVILFLIAALFAFGQRDNIKALLQSRNFSAYELEQRLAENNRRLANLHVRDLTDEEKQALRDGTKTREEIMDGLIDAEEKTPYELDLSRLIAEIYILRTEYSFALEDMAEQAKDEYRAKDESERAAKELVKWAKTYITRANQMEKECDAKMDDILARMNDLIEQYDEDDSIVKEVISTYAEEKSLKKSWYLAQMRERGLLE